MNHFMCGALALLMNAFHANDTYAGVQDGNSLSLTIATNRASLVQSAVYVLPYPQATFLNTAQQKAVTITEEAKKIAAIYRENSEKYKNVAETSRTSAAKKTGEEKQKLETMAKLCGMESDALKLAAIFLEKGIWEENSLEHLEFKQYKPTDKIKLAAIDMNRKFIYEKDDKGKKSVKIDPLPIFGAEFRYEYALLQGHLNLFGPNVTTPKFTPEQCNYVTGLLLPGKKYAALTPHDKADAAVKAADLSLVLLRAELALPIEPSTPMNTTPARPSKP